MPEAVLVTTASAVAAALNAAPADTFDYKFNPERSYADWELPLEDSKPSDGSVLVDVVPVPPLPTELTTRGLIGYTPSVDIVIRLRLDPSNREADGRLEVAQIDGLLRFVEQVSEYFSTDRLTSTDAVWQSTQILRAFVPQHLREKHQFTAQIRLTFSTSNAVT